MNYADFVKKKKRHLLISLMSVPCFISYRRDLLKNKAIVKIIK